MGFEADFTASMALTVDNTYIRSIQLSREAETNT